MATVALMSLGCGSLSRFGRLIRSDEGNELPLFKDLTAASNSKMLYPFSNPNEVELSLATVTCARLKRLTSFSLANKTSLKSDLLKNEINKTESNWLVTPPDSPLFPSLDSEPNGVELRPRKPISPLSRMSKRKRETRAKKNRGSEEKLLENRLDKRLKNRALTWRHVGTMGRPEFSQKCIG